MYYSISPFTYLYIVDIAPYKDDPNRIINSIMEVLEITKIIVQRREVLREIPLDSTVRSVQ